MSPLLPLFLGHPKKRGRCSQTELSGILGEVHSPTSPALEHDLSSLATPGTEASAAAGGRLGCSGGSVQHRDRSPGAPGTTRDPFTAWPVPTGLDCHQGPQD